MLWNTQEQFCTFNTVQVRFCSWNVGAQPPSAESDDSVWREWLGLDGEEESKKDDILVIGLQEIVDLAFMSNNARNSNDVLDEWARELKRRLGPEFRLIHAASMVGLGILVAVRGVAMREALKFPGEEAVKTGLGGMHGNKGALVWRAFVYDTPLAVAVAHLAAGHKAVTERNSDAATILKNATLPSVTDEFAFPTGNSGTRILDHAATFLLGDLNYRIDLEREVCESLVKAGTLPALLANDQLIAQQQRPDLLLSCFHEPSLSFAPTYKYDPGTLNVFDSSEKRRVPAWCDRILVHTNGCTVNDLQYNSIPSATASDHKPIYATFELKCRSVNQETLQKMLINSTAR